MLMYVLKHIQVASESAVDKKTGVCAAAKTLHHLGFPRDSSTQYW